MKIESLLEIIAKRMIEEDFDEAEQMGCGSLTAIVESRVFSSSSEADSSPHHTVELPKSTNKVFRRSASRRCAIDVAATAKLFAGILIDGLLSQHGCLTVSLEAAIYHEFTLLKQQPDGFVWILDSFCRSRKPGFWLLGNQSDAWRFAESMWSIFCGDRLFSDSHADQAEMMFYRQWFGETVTIPLPHLQSFTNNFITISAPRHDPIFLSGDTAVLWRSLSNEEIRSRSHLMFHQYHSRYRTATTNENP